MRSRYFIFLPLDVSIYSRYKESSMRAYRHTSNVCTDTSATTAMEDYDRPHPSSGEEEECVCGCDSSLQTQPPTPPMRDTCNGNDSQPEVRRHTAGYSLSPFPK